MEIPKISNSNTLNLFANFGIVQICFWGLVLCFAIMFNFSITNTLLKAAYYASYEILTWGFPLLFFWEMNTNDGLNFRIKETYCKDERIITCFLSGIICNIVMYLICTILIGNVFHLILPTLLLLAIFCKFNPLKISESPILTLFVLYGYANYSILWQIICDLSTNGKDDGAIGGFLGFVYLPFSICAGMIFLVLFILELVIRPKWSFKINKKYTKGKKVASIYFWTGILGNAFWILALALSATADWFD